MNRLDPEVLKMIADALHETIQCPVCLVTLRPPVTLCSRGHGLCPDCKPQVAACPTCREAFIPTKPLLLHQLLDVLPRECQFKNQGCTEVFIPGGSHESLCSYRSVVCKLMDCEWSGQARRLEAHLLSDHIEQTKISVGATPCMDLQWHNFNISEASSKYIPFIAHSQVFWEYIHMNVEVRKLCISFTLVSSESSNCDYFAIISFKKGDVEYTYTINIPLDHDEEFVDFYEEFCMTVPGNMLCRFLDSDSTLKYNVRIVKEDRS